MLTICTRVRVLEDGRDGDHARGPTASPSLGFDLSHRCATSRPGQPSVGVPSALSTVHPIQSALTEHPVRRRHLALIGSNGDVLRLGDLGVSDGSPSKRDEEESAALVEHSGKLHG